jgi:hypothetical protein
MRIVVPVLAFGRDRRVQRESSLLRRNPTERGLGARHGGVQMEQMGRRTNRKKSRVVQRVYTEYRECGH